MFEAAAAAGAVEAAEAALREDSGDEGVAAVELKAAIVAQLHQK